MANDSSSGLFLKTGIFAALAGVGWLLFSFFSGKKTDAPTAENDLPSRPKIEESAANKPEKPAPNFEINPSDPTLYEPTSTTGAVVRHTWFTLSYSEDHEQAEWVSYELTRERLDANFAERTNSFLPDQAVKTESATPRDYSGSGFDKGHLCPAADMGFDKTAMAESFYMSNISPQRKAFNIGIWRELEENVRDWARRFRHIYVVTGPVLTDKIEGQIGFSKVSIPGYFYKIVFDSEKAIAFLIPNQKSDRPLMEFAVTVDRIERVTGINFFPKMSGNQEEIEARLDKPAWETSEARFSKRVTDWNRAGEN